MVKLAFYDKNKTYITPDNNVATPEMVQSMFSAVNIAKCVIETDSTDGVMLFALNTFSSMKQLHLNGEDISSMTDDEILNLLENRINNPVQDTGEYTPSSEEIIASQLILQNLLAMQDI